MCSSDSTVVLHWGAGGKGKQKTYEDELEDLPAYLGYAKGLGIDGKAEDAVKVFPAER